jgi:hypothetical protein
LITIFGLPAHILIVHAAVVLVPLAAIAVILITCVPRWRSSHALLAALFSAGAVTAVALASQTGESLQESVKRTDLPLLLACYSPFLLQNGRRSTSIAKSN